MTVRKLVAFSFDDGVTQDRRLTALLNGYGLRATFNLNSALLGLPGCLPAGEGTVRHDKVLPDEVAALYRGHEVASHTLVHPDLRQLSAQAVAYQVEEDRLALERLTGGEVIGFAYPGGSPNWDEAVLGAVREHTGIRYARTVDDTFGFAVPADFLRWNPTCSALHPRAEELARRFLDLDAEAAPVLFFWGHSYELDIGAGGWDRMERLCALISGRADISYLTCAQAYRALTASDCSL